MIKGRSLTFKNTVACQTAIFFIAHLHLPPVSAGHRLHGGDFKGKVVNDIFCDATSLNTGGDNPAEWN